MNDHKIKIMAIGGQKLINILQILEEEALPGVNLLKIEKRAWELIEKQGGYPSFAQVPGYRHATCLNVNDGVVHGIPHDYRLKEGDLLNIDVGFFYKGYHTDCAKSIIISEGKKNYPRLQKFLSAGKKALDETIKTAAWAKYIGHLSAVIQRIIENSGYWSVRQYTGHGIGRKLHEAPTIPCVLLTAIEKTPLLSYNTESKYYTKEERPQDNMTLAIEVIYMMEKTPVKILADGWSVKTSNGCFAACFEKTIALTKEGVLVLTDW